MCLLIEQGCCLIELRWYVKPARSVCCARVVAEAAPTRFPTLFLLLAMVLLTEDASTATGRSCGWSPGQLSHSEAPLDSPHALADLIPLREPHPPSSALRLALASPTPRARPVHVGRRPSLSTQAST